MGSASLCLCPILFAQIYDFYPSSSLIACENDWLPCFQDHLNAIQVCSVLEGIPIHSKHHFFYTSHTSDQNNFPTEFMYCQAPDAFLTQRQPVEFL